MTSETLAGLEAIKFMEQGGMIIEKDVDEPCILKIENGVMWFKNPNILDGCWMVNTNFDLSLSYEEYIESKQLTGWERVGHLETVYFIDFNCKVAKEIEMFSEEDEKYCRAANYFSTREKAEEINFKQTLFRKLQRFSDENGGAKGKWNYTDTQKFIITYDCYDKELSVDWFCNDRFFGSVYFISEEVAQQAIDLFHDDLIKYFTM